MRHLGLAVGMVAGLFFCITEATNASTTSETTGWCRYTNTQGKVVFSGQCLVNWGVGGADGCAEPTNLAERYILRFSPKSEVWIYIFCDDSASINNKRGILTKGWKGETQIYQVLTEERELFEFEQGSE